MANQGALSFEERTHSLFHSDPLSSNKFFETSKTRAYPEPERFLMLAVLQDAVTCLEKYAAFGSRGNKRLFDEARDWILSEDGDWLFSFNNVCEAVGLNPGYVRRRLIQMSEPKRALPCNRKLLHRTRKRYEIPSRLERPPLAISAGPRQRERG
jgi:hypothetical protein